MTLMQELKTVITGTFIAERQQCENCIILWAFTPLKGQENGCRWWMLRTSAASLSQSWLQNYFQINCSFFLAIFPPAEKPGYHYLNCVLNLKQVQENLYETKKPVLNVQMIFCSEWLQKWKVELLNSKTLC